MLRLFIEIVKQLFQKLARRGGGGTLLLFAMHGLDETAYLTYSFFGQPVPNFLNMNSKIVLGNNLIIEIKTNQ
jgi:hypothetical protein